MLRSFIFSGDSYWSFISDELVHEKEKFKAISDELDQTFAEMSGYWKQKLLRSPTLSHQLSSLFLCVFSVQLASNPMLFLLGSTQIASYWSNSGIIGHLYIFKLYRISANHTNVQLSPKTSNMWNFCISWAPPWKSIWRSWTLLVSPSPQLQSVVCTCLCLFIHNNLYRSYVCHRIWLLKFLENRVKWQYSLLCTDYELFEIFKSNKLYKISQTFGTYCWIEIKRSIMKLYWKARHENGTCSWQNTCIGMNCLDTIWLRTSMLR